MRQFLPGQSNLSRHNEPPGTPLRPTPRIAFEAIGVQSWPLRDAIVSSRDFLESYGKPFKACAKAKAMGVMCAYNQATVH